MEGVLGVTEMSVSMVFCVFLTPASCFAVWTEHSSQHVPSPACPALPCPALPCPALPCPALPCPACPSLHQIELPKLSLDKFTDSYFKAAEDKQKGAKGEDEFFKKGEGAVVCLFGCWVGL
jgi:hypothetical protein